MRTRLSQKDIRALKVGGICVVAVLALAFLTRWFDHWGRVRKSLASAKAQLKLIDPAGAKQAGLLSVVPVFEMPQEQQEQKFLFRDKLDEQLKKAGIKSEPLQVLPVGKSRGASGYKLLCLRYSGKCKFDQVLDLLASLPENPYLVGIEELKISCDTDVEKRRQKIELNLTVSTFTK